MFQHGEEVGHANGSVTIDVQQGVVCSPSANDGKEILNANFAVVHNVSSGAGVARV